MDTLPLITLLFALVATVAWIWLLVRGFKINAKWGFAILLLSPFSAIFFGVYHWDKQKQPFLLYTTTFTAMFALLIYMFTVSGGMEAVRIAYKFKQGNVTETMTEHLKNGMIPINYSVEEKSAQDGMFQQDPGFLSELEEDSDLMDTEPEAEATAAIEEKPVRTRLTYIPVKITDINKYIGATAKVTRKNVEEREYLITGVSPRHIEVAQRSRKGKFSFRFKNSDIKNIRVLINENY